QVFAAMWAGEGPAEQIVANRGLRQVRDDNAIAALVEEVLAENPEQVAQYRAGKDKVLGYLVGQVMKKSNGKANPQMVNEFVTSRLKEN
ncbi:MAG: Asp-tRNA(Asn)/Glu-tRNA(Gln) amidotransferase subunit GatB, partial [Gammaproteobacteria bacterium]